ncbi:MAG: OmpA family protein [Alphaproteobacteria bacterium]|nr:MAG: OmpA family protein [Alphaproteobacteria bacterium]
MWGYWDMKSFPLLLSVFILAGCCSSAPAPMPAPAPAPVAETTSRDFVIYFGFDRSDLTDAARATVDAIAEYASGMDGSSVSLRGHTDSSGTSAYNQGLSQRRANSVASALAAAGVGSVSSSWAGESELAVETGDGVREPLNRRVNVRVDG